MVRAYFEAYGCTLNQGEARNMRDILRQRDWEIVEKPEESDAIILATCTVIDFTERKMLKRIDAFQRRGYPLVVTGCLPAVQREKVLEIAPNAEILPISEIDGIEEAVLRAIERTGYRREERGGKRLACQKLSLSKPKEAVLKPTTGLDAIIPISQGCLGECTYCITRLARGRLKSYSVERILDDVRISLKEGAKEIRLTAQDSAAYADEKGRKLPELLARITGEIGGDYRIRVGMMNPNSTLSILDPLIEAYRDEKVYKFLHLPLQSGNDRVLEEMRRGYRASDFIEIVQRFRKAFPSLMLSTDVIVGFPGEGEAEFMETVHFVEKMRPDIINVTRFSPRPGTPATRMKKRVPGWKMKVWSRKLSSLRFIVSKEINTQFVGKRLSVMVTENGKNGTVIGRTDEYRPLVLKEKVELGERVRAEVIDVSSVYLIGAVGQNYT